MRIYIAKDKSDSLIPIRVSNKKIRRWYDQYFRNKYAYNLLIFRHCIKDFEEITKIKLKEGQQICIDIPYKVLKKYIKEIK